MAPRKPYTVEEAADMLSCHPETIRRAIRKGKLVAYRMPGGRRWYIEPTMMDVMAGNDQETKDRIDTMIAEALNGRT